MEIVGKKNESENKPADNKPTKRWGLWFWGYVVAGIVYYEGNKNFVTTPIDRFIVAIIAITAGILYYRIIRKRTIKLVKSDAGEDLIDAIIVLIVSGLLTGFLTRMF